MGNWCTGKTQQYHDKPVVVNPYSPQGEAFRNQVLGSAGTQLPGAISDANRAAGMFMRGAGDPGWGDARRLATDTIRGTYLRSNPYLEQGFASTRRAGLSSVADQNARMAEQFQRAGLAFSTGNQQAQQAQTAATASQIAAAEDQARLQNYQAERQNQQNAAQMLALATTTPAMLAGQASDQRLRPVAAGAEIAQLGRNEVTVPGSTVVKKPGALDYGIATLGAINF